MEGTMKGDKYIVVLEHEAQSAVDGMEKDYWFWREACGYVQLWFFNGIVLDVLKRDEARFMWE